MLDSEIIELCWHDKNGEYLFYSDSKSNITAKVERLFGVSVEFEALNTIGLPLSVSIIPKVTAFFKLLRSKKPGLERFISLPNAKGYPFCWDFGSIAAIESVLLTNSQLDWLIYYKKPVTLQLLEIMQEITGKTYSKNYSLFVK